MEKEHRRRPIQIGPVKPRSLETKTKRKAARKRDQSDPFGISEEKVGSGVWIPGRESGTM